MITTILAPTDFSEGSRRALDLALELANQFDATLWLVHVGTVVGEGAGADYVGNTRAEIQHLARAERAKLAASRMATLAEELREANPGLKLETRMVGGTPHAAIIQAATEVDAGLIVMGTAGLTGLPHFLIGSTAERVVRMSTIPVLTVRGDKEPR